MTSFSFRLLAVATLMGISSCTQQAHSHMTDSSASEAKKPQLPRRPVLMNGRGKITSISIENFFKLQQSGDVLLFDARPGFFYALGHISGAISMPKADCDELITKREGEIKAAIAAKKPIVVYCTNLLCPDARAVADHLAGRGYSSSTLTGGWESWKEAGLPTE